MIDKIKELWKTEKAFRYVILFVAFLIVVGIVIQMIP